MTLIAAFKTAWLDFKAGLTKVDTYLQAKEPGIQTSVQTGVAIAEALLPAAAPILTSADNIEVAAMAELTAAVHSGAAIVNASTGAAAVTLSAGLYSSVKALAATLGTHPAVAAATVPVLSAPLGSNSVKTIG